MVALPVDSTTPWKDKLNGNSLGTMGTGLEEKDDFELLEGDFQKSVVNGTPSIKFSERIRQILLKDMENSGVLKLLGLNIGFTVLQIRSIVYGSHQHLST